MKNNWKYEVHLPNHISDRYGEKRIIKKTGFSSFEEALRDFDKNKNLWWNNWQIVWIEMDSFLSHFGVGGKRSCLLIVNNNEKLPENLKPIEFTTKTNWLVVCSLIVFVIILPITLFLTLMLLK